MYLIVPEPSYTKGVLFSPQQFTIFWSKCKDFFMYTDFYNGSIQVSIIIFNNRNWSYSLISLICCLKEVLCPKNFREILYPKNVDYPRLKSIWKFKDVCLGSKRITSVSVLFYGFSILISGGIATEMFSSLKFLWGDFVSLSPTYSKLFVYKESVSLGPKTSLDWGFISGSVLNKRFSVDTCSWSCIM